jgi:hypothetical protein
MAGYCEHYNDSSGSIRAELYVYRPEQALRAPRV